MDQTDTHSDKPTDAEIYSVFQLTVSIFWRTTFGSLSQLL